MKRIALLLAVIFMCLGIVPHVKAHGSTVQLAITPVLCIIDVVQDGSNQTVRPSSPGCEDALPDLMTMVDQPLKDQPITSPFAAGAHTPLVLQPKTTKPLHITAKEHDGPPPVSSAKKSYLAVALMAAALACAIGIGVVLYRMRYRPKAPGNSRSDREV